MYFPTTGQKTTRRKSHRSGRKGSSGLFGGKILTHAQIQALNARIKAHESAEFEDFEEDFDRTLNQLEL